MELNHRLTAPGLPRRVRPDADRDPGRLGDHRHPAHRGAHRARAVDRGPSRVRRARAGRPGAGRRVHRPVQDATAPTASSPPSSPGRRDGAPLDDAVQADLERGVEAAANAYERIGERPAHRPARPRPRGGCRGPRALRARVPPVPRRHRRPRGDLRVGRGARADRGRHARHRRPDRARRLGRGGDRAPRRRPAHMLHGTDALRDWMQERADEVIADMADTHFDIPDPMRTSSAGSPRPRPAASTTPGRPRTSPARAACGGRCPRASTSSTPGAS